MSLLNGLQYVGMLFLIMIIAGVVKDHNLFAPLFGGLRHTFKNNRVVLALVSALGGILPIEGRVTVSAGILDTMTKDGDSSGRRKMGVVDYLTTHHYYIWSPIEKTVILPIAAFGLTYGEWLSLMWPLLVASLAFITAYIYFFVSEEDININVVPFHMGDVLFNVTPFIVAIIVYATMGTANNVIFIFSALAAYYVMLTETFAVKKLWSYVKPSVLLAVAAIIVIANGIKMYESEFTSIASGFADNIILLSAINFVASFLMGSSGKYAALAVMSSQIAGIQYFIWFFVIDYIGYLISPTHKCVMIGCQYFKTPVVYYYKVIFAWAAVLLVTALATFLI